MGCDLCYHFWIFDCYRKVLLTQGLPVHSAELVNLVNQLFHRFNILHQFWVGALNFYFYREWVSIKNAWFVIIIPGIVEK